MRYLVPLLLICNMCLGQLAPSSLGPPVHLNLATFKPHSSNLSLQTSKWVKLTISAGYNRPNWFLKPMDKCDESSGEDFYVISQFDIRLKIYLSRRFRLLNRVLVKGDTKKSLYQTGIIYKF